jgi:energy-converting hydrogenase A subunit M
MMGDVHSDMDICWMFDILDALLQYDELAMLDDVRKNVCGASGMPEGLFQS